jgi:hypothetical protein
MADRKSWAAVASELDGSAEIEGARVTPTLFDNPDTETP